MKKYSKKESEILNTITSFCQDECGSCQDCPEDECVLYRIEQIIVGTTKKRESTKIHSTAECCSAEEACPDCSLDEQVNMLEAIGAEIE